MENYNEHIIKLTNRYLFQKAKLKNHLNNQELQYMRTVLSTNDHLANNVLYFANHASNELSKDAFLQNFTKYFTFDDRCYRLMGKRHEYIISRIQGKPSTNVMFTSEYTSLSFKEGGTYSYWANMGKTNLPWDFYNHNGRQDRFFLPTILKESDGTIKTIGIQIDKEKLSQHLDKLNLWDIKVEPHQIYDKWKSPNYVMFDPLCKAAYYKLLDSSDAKEVTKNAMIPIDYSNIDSFNEQQSLQIKQPDTIQNVSLKFYQSSNVGWMVNFERNNEKYGITYSPTNELSKGIYVDIADKTFHKNSKGFVNIIPKGGGLFDEVGLGKTLCIITLAAANPRDMIEIPNSIVEKIEKSKKSNEKGDSKLTSKASNSKSKATCEAKLKNGTECGNNVNKPSAKSTTDYTYDQLVLYRTCLKHAKAIIGNSKDPNKVPPKKATPLLDDKKTTPIKTTPVIEPEENLEVDGIAFQIPKTDNRYNSKATLVVCPNQIPYQWKSQIEQYTNPKMKVVLLTTLLESRNVSYLDMINADFVIITFNALERTLCDLNPHKKETCEHPPKKLPPLSTRIPKLCHFHFHRIVIDESHEIIDKKFKNMLPKLYELKTNYKWCVSGTPFKEPLLNYDMMLTWLFDGQYKDEGVERLYALIQGNHKTFRNMFRRNTKDSVQNVVPLHEQHEIALNDGVGGVGGVGGGMLAEQRLWQTTSEEIIWLSLSEIERAMYNARLMTIYGDPSTDTYLKQICCSPTLNTENSSVICDINYSISKGTDGAKQIKEGLIIKTQGLIDEMYKHEIPERIQKMWENLEIFKEDVDDKRSRLVYYTSIHHLKRSFLRMYQLLKSKREYETSNTFHYNKPLEKSINLFKCSSCKALIQIHEIYDKQKGAYELNTTKSDIRFGVGECGHFFCGKCSFDTYKYKLQLDEVKSKLKPVKKKRKTDDEEKMGSCVYGYCNCNEDECKIINDSENNGGDGYLKSRKVNVVGLPNALIVQAQSSSECSKDCKNDVDVDVDVDNNEDEDVVNDNGVSELTGEVEEERALSPVHSHIKKQDGVTNGIPDYVTGIFREEYDCNINLYGTKVTNLVAYLKTYTNEPYNQRVILFSQYDSFLASIKDTLTQFGLSCVSCKGNVFSKRKAINNFKDDAKYRIILISSRFSASGLDLIEANKIIFIDPVYGNYKEVRAIETQAIGRAHRLGQKHPVKVVRFLMENTIEEGAFKDYSAKMLNK